MAKAAVRQTGRGHQVRFTESERLALLGMMSLLKDAAVRSPGGEAPLFAVEDLSDLMIKEMVADPIQRHSSKEDGYVWFRRYVSFTLVTPPGFTVVIELQKGSNLFDGKWTMIDARGIANRRVIWERSWHDLRLPDSGPARWI